MLAIRLVVRPSGDGIFHSPTRVDTSAKSNGNAATRYRLAISGVNLTEGGPLTVLQEFVAATCAVLPQEWLVIVFVNNRRLLQSSRAKCIPIPCAKRGWLRRLWVEWWTFRKIARRLRIDLWISMHDVTPNVGNIAQVVYCHNAAAFYSLRPGDVFFEPKLIFYRFLYVFLYRLRIKRNHTIVVQQSWLRDAFRRWTREDQNIIVAYPQNGYERMQHTGTRSSKNKVFLYPSLSRPFKNFEVLCRAVLHLERDDAWRSSVILTIDGTENRYSKWVLKRFGTLRTVQFRGRQTREELDRLYADCDCLVFPSKLESWGLPISEARHFGLAVLVANLPYAKETVGNYDRADFFDADDHLALAEKLLEFQNGRMGFCRTNVQPPADPFAPNWCALVSLIFPRLSFEPSGHSSEKAPLRS